MNGDLLELYIVLSGLLATAALFYHIPKLPEHEQRTASYPSVSVIIPARNEERNLPLILKDLSSQSRAPLEIICADDGSEDETAKIALSYGAKLISIDQKPDGWIGKSFACQKGADSAKGDLLLFLDADVRLGKESLSRLLDGYLTSESTISVQPFHKTEKMHEQFSMIFNLVQIAANGSALKKPYNIGLYGPLIMISREDYERAGKHEVIKDSVIEDVSLGMEMKKRNLPYRIFVGDEDISFRMYGEGFRSLLEGWTKNFAAGASKTPILLLILVFLWITSMTSVPLHLVQYLLYSERTWLGIYMAIYTLWAVILWHLSKKIGRFHFFSALFYPVT